MNSPPPPGDTAAFDGWAREIERWRGDVDRDRLTIARTAAGAHKRVDKLDERLDGVATDVAVIKTKVAFYAALGSVIGGAIVTAIFAIGSKAVGGG